ncbi:MAG TPA: tetratricopeptide repeat protein [Candidatus Eisenbacteria bacterium]
MVVSDRSVMLALLLAVGLPPLWAPGPAANKKGNEAWKKGEFDKAAGQYARALDALPAEKKLVFNRGTALLAQKKPDEALSALVSATADPRREVKAPAFYNAGNGLFDGQKLDEAIDAYKRAILADPSDEDAKFNYELATRKKKQQDQQKKDQQKNQDKNKQDQKNDQQQKDQQQQKEQQDQNQQDQSQQPPPDQQDQQQPPKPQPAAQMSKEQAEQLLDALKANEKEMIKARMTSKRKRDVDKDW